MPKYLMMIRFIGDGISFSVSRASFLTDAWCSLSKAALRYSRSEMKLVAVIGWSLEIGSSIGKKVILVFV